MLREASGIKRVIVACGRTDLRRGIDGLAAIVRLAYGLDPLEEGIFIPVLWQEKGQTERIDL